MDKATELRHTKNAKGYCMIYLGIEYIRMCKMEEHKGKKGNRKLKTLAIIESFRKMSDIRGTWLSSK